MIKRTNQLMPEPFDVTSIHEEPSLPPADDSAGTGPSNLRTSRRHDYIDDLRRLGAGTTEVIGVLQSEESREGRPSEARDQDRVEDIPEDPINPSHYRKHPSGIECIDVTRHMNFNTGNAVKYIWRYMDKGNPVENLQKAQWYLDDEIRRLQGLR